MTVYAAVVGWVNRKTLLLTIDRRSRTRLTSLKVWLVLLVSQLLQRERFEIQLLMSIDIQKIFHNV